MTDVTEFTLMDTDELHLVTKGANGFPQLMLKDVSESEAVALATQRAGARIDAILKAAVSTKDQNDLPDSDFAYIEPGGKKDKDGKTTPRSLRHFPIMDAAHVRNALARASQSPFGDKAMPKIKAAAKKFGIDMAKAAAILDAIETLTDAKAHIDALVKDTAMAVRPTPNDPANADGDPTVPGSLAWEANDAARLIAAGQVITTALAIVNAACQREQMEVATGHADDSQDVWDLQTAEDALNCALGIVARISFTEEHEGQMTDVAKALVEQCETKIRAALLGDSNQPDSRAAVSKSTSEEVLNMELSEQELTERITKASEEAATAAVTKFTTDLADLAKAQADKVAAEAAAEAERVAKAKADEEAAEADRLAKEKAEADAAKTPEELAKEAADAAEAEAANDPIAKAVAAGIEAGLSKAGELIKSAVDPLKDEIATFAGQPRTPSVRFTAPRGGDIAPEAVYKALEERFEKSTDPVERYDLGKRLAYAKTLVHLGHEADDAMGRATATLPA